uniref:Monocarboxylate transporter 3-like n=1 Tax=Saccoglossus kowalevskii TaxID=10224 RepID=A0ABM0MRI4_SACKO
MGVFLVVLLDYFGESTGKTATIQSLQSFMMLFPGPVVSSLNNKFGTRPMVVIGGICSSAGLLLCSFANSINALLVTYGVIVGLASGMSYGPSIVIIGHYFHKRHAVANGIVFAGTGTGIMVLPPLCQVLIDTYGWRGAIIVIAGINLNIVVCGMLMRAPRQCVREREDGTRTKDNINTNVECIDDDNAAADDDDDINKERLLEAGDVVGTNNIQIDHYRDSYMLSQSTNEQTDDVQSIHNAKSPLKKIGVILALHLFTNSWFRILLFSVLFWSTGHLLFLFHLVNRAVSDDIPILDATFVMTILGICSILGRVLHGWFVDLGYFSPMFLSSCAFCVCGASALLVLVANGNYWVYALMAILYGTSCGIGVALHGSVSMKVCVGTEHLSSAFGWYLFSASFGNALGPFLG